MNRLSPEKDWNLHNPDTPAAPATSVESAVLQRYTAASMDAEPALCCAVDYDSKYLKVLPQPLIDRDYGCGNPAKWVSAGETVLDLGSGGGKICYIASQVVGATGTVIGVDMNDDMLQLARQYQPEIATNIGFDNVHFFKGRIQDLALDLEAFERHLNANPVRSANDWLEASRVADQMKTQSPMIASNSIDVVVSNCVLNLVKPEDRIQMFRELARVLRQGGRAIISDIVSDKPVPASLKDDAKLWSGCISGAFVEPDFLRAFEDAGFVTIEIVERLQEPWQNVEGIEFRSITVRAFKPFEKSSGNDTNHIVTYRGPWKSVCDERGNEFVRGEPSGVSNDVLLTIAQSPVASQFTGIERVPGLPKSPATKRGSLEVVQPLDSKCCSDDNPCC